MDIYPACGRWRRHLYRAVTTFPDGCQFSRVYLPAGLPPYLARCLPV